MPAMRRFIRDQHAHRGPFDLNRGEGKKDKPLDSLMGALSGRKKKRPIRERPRMYRRHIPQAELLRRGYVPVVKFNEGPGAPRRTMYRYDPRAAASMVRSAPRPLPASRRSLPKRKGMFAGLNASLDSLLGTTPKMKETREKSKRGLFGGH